MWRRAYPPRSASDVSMATKYETATWVFEAFWNKTPDEPTRIGVTRYAIFEDEAEGIRLGFVAQFGVTHDIRKRIV